MTHRSKEAGLTTIQFALATALSLLAFVVLANFIVFLYARGVVRAAVDEAARVGGRHGASVEQCENRAADVLQDLVQGLQTDVQVVCTLDDGIVRSEASVTLRGWVPPATPDWSFTLTAQSVRERVT